MSILKSEKYNEKELLQRMSQDDQEAYSQIIRNYSGLIHSFIYRHVQRPDWVEEIAADIFLQIWLSRKSNVQINNFNTYLFVLCRNHSINALKKELREIERNANWYKNIYQAEINFYDKEKEEKLCLIDDAIEKLPFRQKQIWLLSRKQGFTYEQIARELNIAKETVKTHLQAANESIKKQVVKSIKAISFLLFF